MKNLYISDDPTQTESTSHNYQAKLQSLIDQGKIPSKGLFKADIYHNYDCTIFEGGYCNCDPDIVILHHKEKGRQHPPPKG